MNKGMLTGMLAGVGIAIAGGVAGFTLLGDSSVEDEQVNVQATDEAVEAVPAVATTLPDSQGSATAPAAAVTKPAATTAAAPRPAPAATTAAPAVAAPVPQPAAAQATAQVAEECWDEEVEVPVEPKDKNAIAGTAAGAAIGGVIADKLGDDNKLVTAAGAAAGAFFGRRAQQRRQEQQTTTTIERRCAPAGTR